ncbi:hypothetical protein D917_06923 [Trichinella nativa]|uniref:G-protein coupled receptors family 1 profile domain-containing protein n=1 Tax=Trichinella nativa TaxID=6335 RepID=A0A1Y3EUC5_9BILA|nr:hypothetical protein D917_06923 [Trichinella nativa]
MSTDGRVEWSQTMATDSFSQGCHTARAVVGYAATLSTLVYVFLFCKYANLRTKLNWAVCNLITSNGLLALAMAIFSTLKAVDEHFLHDYCGCIVFTWVLVFLSFAPSWSVALMASTRAIHYSNFPSLDGRRRISLPILVAVRLFTASADAIVTSVIVSQKESIALATRCTYQLMLDTSPVYMIYTLVIILALVTAGLWAIISRIRCRRKLLASLSANGAVGHDSPRLHCSKPTSRPTCSPSPAWSLWAWLWQHCSPCPGLLFSSTTNTFGKYPPSARFSLPCSCRPFSSTTPTSFDLV